MGGKHKKKEEKKKNVAPASSPDGHSLPWKILVLFFAFLFAILHRNHVAAMFESDRHFSHLSDLEREMTFRTEMGLYYSYYKTLVKAPSLAEGVEMITKDNVSEYGHTINTLKRFNLYPELILAILYRGYKDVAAKLDWKTMECWQTNRGEGLEPIVSCEGMGNQFYFYINHVFLIAGSLAAVLFLYGVLLSDSIFGGLLTIAAFFFNHGEATRVQWTPPLRESFGYPIWATQMLVITYVIKYRKTGPEWTFLIGLLTLSFMLPWQFASFAICTQVISIFIAYVLDYLPASTLRTISFGHLMFLCFQLAFILGYIMMFGNEMLLTSLFLSSLISTQLVLLMDWMGGKTWKKFSFRPLFLVLLLGIFGAGTLGIKFGIGSVVDVKDDAHIFEILANKFSNFSNFHTRLYTCAVEFDFLETVTYWKLSQTLLLPAAIGGVLLFLCKLFQLEVPHIIWRDVPLKEKPYGELVYNFAQLAAYTLMAVIIMRLKLFWTPHLCIFAALLGSQGLMQDIFGDVIRPGIQKAGCVALIAMMAYKGVANIQQQWSIMGEYSNLPQEQLFEWIEKTLPKDAVFAGAMPTMANIKLSTERPIVNHPHYEDAELRERTKKVYSIFSRKPIQEVYKTLQDMGVNYIVFESGWCNRGPKAGCSMPEVWDEEDPVNKGRPAMCNILRTQNFEPFTLAYENQHYRVFKIG